MPDCFTRAQLESALNAMASMMSMTMSAKDKFAPGTSQYSLLKNRLNALTLSSSLISHELIGGAVTEYPRADLKEALAPIASLVSKSEKARGKVAETTWQHSMLSRNLEALHIASRLLAKAFGTAGP